MKLHSLCIVLCAISATGSLFSSENFANGDYLKFKLDPKLQIIGAGEYGSMKFLLPKDEFMNKVITDVVPLNEEDKRAINVGFAKARVDGKVHNVPYALEQAKFLSAIYYKQKRDGFVVMVTED
jgi:hypothetical protein